MAGKKQSAASIPAGLPAQLLTTAYEWDELVLDRRARRELEDIVAWARHEKTLLRGWKLDRCLQPGFRALFHGPAGTGKTLAAAVLGKTLARPVYRVDLAGLTEQNLASLFDHAERKSAILFFDEADALFGRRTESRNANDRAANQQIAYLLQRLEDFGAILILATRLRSHLDEAFARRFQSEIHFALPDAEQRRRLWEAHFQDKPYRLEEGADLERLAHDHELSGGAILNVLRYACLRAVSRRSEEIRGQDLQRGAQREAKRLERRD